MYLMGEEIKFKDSDNRIVTLSDAMYDSYGIKYGWEYSIDKENWISLIDKTDVGTKILPNGESNYICNFLTQPSVKEYDLWLYDDSDHPMFNDSLEEKAKNILKKAFDVSDKKYHFRLEELSLSIDYLYLTRLDLNVENRDKLIDDLYEKVKEFYPGKEKEVMGNIRMMHFASRKEVNQNTGVKHFNIVSLADDMFVDLGVLADDHIYNLLQRQNID